MVTVRLNINVCNGYVYQLVPLMEVHVVKMHCAMVPNIVLFVNALLDCWAIHKRLV